MEAMRSSSIWDKLGSGGIISTYYLTENDVTAVFQDVSVAQSYVYFDICYDRDGSEWHSTGDSFSFYKNGSDEVVAVDISQGAVEIEFAFDDSELRY